MMLANDGWTDEARDASLAVRRAKMIERKRLAFFKANPEATEADWKQHDAKELAAWKRRKDEERRLKPDPDKAKTYRQARDKEQSQDSRKRRQQADEEMFKVQAEGPRYADEFFVENWIPRGDDGTAFPSVIVDDETGEAVEVPPDMREKLIDGWIDDEEPVTVADPHWGRWSEDAPYGYHDRTGEPRKEPLYDVHGRPIVPRLPERHSKKRKDFEAEPQGWLERSKKALDEWGYWGRKKK